MSDILTPKQEAFCLRFLEVGNASEAFRDAYRPSENMKPATVNRNAKRMMDMDKIRTRIDELRAPVVEAAQLTLEAHIAKLAELRDKADNLEQMSAAIQAETNRGKASGHYITRSELTGKDGFPLGEVPTIIVNFTSRKPDLSILSDEERRTLEAIARKLDVSETAALEAIPVKKC